MRLKPKVLLDIKPSFKTDVFSKRSNRINLSYKPQRKRIYLTTLWFLVPFIIIIPLTLFGKVAAPVTTSGASSSVAGLSETEEERRALEEELRQLEEEMAEYEKQINVYRSQGASLKGEINTLNAQVNRINLKIKAINISLEKLNDEISTTVNDISFTEEEIESSKVVLAGTLRIVYENDEEGLMEILLKNPKLSEFFGSVNDLLAVQDSLRISLARLKVLKDELMNQKEQLSLEKTDAEALRDYQAQQKNAVGDIKKEKDSLLTVTKGKESEYKKLLEETKATAAEIRSRIFRFIGGGELTFENAYQYAKLAEQFTGIRAAMILAVLDQESALGRNVGQCDYKTAMHPRRDIPVFLEIIKELGLESDLAAGIIKVSCPISSDGAYGGAMGPAQFIPSTWALYKDEIARVTGNNPPNPWNNSDAFIATALYLKDAYNSSSCVNYANQYSHILPKQTLQERCAAAKYYAGSRWFTYRFIYGDSVLTIADGFEDDIKILTQG